MDGLSGLCVPNTQRVAVGRVGEKILSSPTLVNVSEEVLGSIRSLKASQEGGKVLLIIDQLDLLLAAGGEQIGAVGLGDMLMGLREVCLQYSRMIKVTEIRNRRFIRRLLRSQRTFHLCQLNIRRSRKITPLSC